MQARRTMRVVPFWCAIVLLLCAGIPGLVYAGNASNYRSFANGAPITVAVVERADGVGKTFEYERNGTLVTGPGEYVRVEQMAGLNVGDTVNALRHSSGAADRFVLRDSVADLQPSIVWLLLAIGLLVAAWATFWLAFTPIKPRPANFDVVAESVRRTYRGALLMALAFGVMGVVIALPLVFGSGSEPNSLAVWLGLGSLVLGCGWMVVFSGRTAWRNRTVANSPLQRALTDQPSPIVWVYVGITEYVVGVVTLTNLADDGRSALDRDSTQTFVNIGLLSTKQMRLTVRDVADAVSLIDNIRQKSPTVRVGYSAEWDKMFRRNPAALQSLA